MAGSTESRAKDIFDEVMDLDEPARAARIAVACGGDDALLARVETLVAAARKLGQFMKVSDSDVGPAPADAADAPGTRIGAYTLIERIGEGGFGAVYMAEQTQPVRRLVALKIIKLGMDTRSVIARFEQERQALALMDHPNIARVVDAGATAAGRPYFVMDLVKGEPVTEFADRRRLTVRDRLRLFLQICAGIQHAHTKGVIHRDIKPSNILVSEHDDRPLARVIDFGIAKATALHLTDRTLITGFHQMIGTPAYMSPEQAAGSLDIDTRSDVYSLGVLLYELLAGVTPLDADAIRAAPYADLQRMIREVDPPTPSTRLSKLTSTMHAIATKRRTEPRRLGALLRADLDWIVMKALEKDRARRYDSAGNLAADVERSLAGLPVDAAPPGVLYRARKFVGRHRVVVAACTAVVAALVLGAVGTAAEFLRASHQRDRAVDAEHAKADLLVLAQQREKAALDQAARADHEAAIASAVNRLLTATLARADRRKEKGNPNLTVREAMDSAVTELDAKPGAYEPEVESAVRLVIGRTYSSLSLYKQSEPQIRAALDIRRRIDGEDSLSCAEALVDLGTLQTRLRAGDCGVASLSQALDIRRRKLGTSDDATIATVAQLGNAYLTRGDLGEGERLAREVLGLRLARYGADDPRVADSHGLLGSILAQSRRLREAVEEFRAAVEIYRRHREGYEGKLFNSLGNLAAAQTDLEEFAEAVPEFREAVQGLRNLLGPDDQQVAFTTFNLGNALSGSGQFDEAEQAFLEAEGAMTRIWGAQHPQVRAPMRGRALVLEKAERYDESAKLADHLVPLERAERGENDVVIARMLMIQGSSYSHLGRTDEAVPILRQALKTAQSADKPDPRLIADVRPRLAEALVEFASNRLHAASSPQPVDDLLREAEVLLQDDSTDTDRRAAPQPESRTKIVERAGRKLEELRHEISGRPGEPAPR